MIERTDRTDLRSGQFEFFDQETEAYKKNLAEAEAKLEDVLQRRRRRRSPNGKGHHAAETE